MPRLETELLAPAGGIEALEAALENGADAVYFGVQSLNARQGAENFRLENLTSITEYIHNNNARAFLTLNIDLTARDIGKAAKILTAAQDAGINAVLFTDPAILLFKPYFPELEFHFSTQASITTSAGIRAAYNLGVTRVVVAREMSAEEIKTACGIPDVEIEVFTQGALCMCISGRCLLSSWGGGKSGNRGACTSPCRVSWRVSNGGTREDILSTQDLSLIEKLPELTSAGVACLKIEGRLKNAAWVAKAVSLYRKVLDGEARYTQEDTLPLGAYTGRSMTDGYFIGERRNVLGTSAGRTSRTSNNSLTSTATTSASTRITPANTPAKSLPEANLPEVFYLSIMSSNQALECKVEYNDTSEEWTLPKTVIRNESRGLSVADTAGWLEKLQIQGKTLGKFTTDDPDFLISKKTANKIADRISAVIHRITRKSTQTAKNEIPLSPEVRQLTRFQERNPENRYTLRDKPNVIRIHITQAAEILRAISPERVIIEEAQSSDIPELLKLCSKSELMLALPPVFFEHEMEKIRQFCQKCKEYNIPLEVNGWDGWQLAQDNGNRFAGGAGIAILNPLAAEALGKLGFEAVCYSLEAGEKQLFDLAKSCPIPAMLTVFSRPVLAHTRANFEDRLTQDTILRDSRGISLSVHFREDITELRSTRPFCLAGIDSPGIRARWICADLIGSPHPLKELKNLHKAKKSPELFNFDRGLF